MRLENIYNARTFDYAILGNYKTLVKHGRNRLSKRILDCVCAFDIETTRLADIEQSIMYIWQFQIDSYTIIGRTWDDFKIFLYKLRLALKGRTMIIFVHNLSFEFQFLRGILPFNSKDVFAVERRKILYAVYYCFEFRCSYLLSNMSLALFTRKMKVPLPKRKKINYAKERFPWSPLTKKDICYAIVDVISLKDAVKMLLQINNDTLATLPLTSTGFVRRECKNRMKTYNKEKLETLKINIEEWCILREAFRGGDAHANRYLSSEILENVFSFDRSSSYPDVIVNCKFPMSKFDREFDISFDDFNRLITRGKACVFRVALKNVKIMRGEPCPYLTVDKSRNLANYTADNGRILYADYLETTITDIDFKIILDMYNFELAAIPVCYFAKYDYLPQQIRDMCIDYYQKKTALKGVEGQEIFYDKFKNDFNSIYGMMAQNPVKRNIIVDTDYHYDDSQCEEEILADHNKHAFLCYQWGVWVTAWARYRLHEGRRLVDADFVYCDTDSVKSLNNYASAFDEYNKQRIADSTKNGAFAYDKNGDIHYMGVYELDGAYDKFVTMGAKKYAYEKDGDIHITVSGVSKKEGAKELKTLENFVDGFTFSKAGGLESVYNDIIEPYTIVRDGRKLEITSNVVLRPSTYTLGRTAEYKRIIDAAKYEIERIKNIY